MKQNSSNTHLWRELNEARTPGKATVDTMPLPSRKFVRLKVDSVEVAHFLQQHPKFAKVYEDKKAEANAAYTALAVNNLASLAEALENLINKMESSMLTADIEYYRVEKNAAKAAIAAIS